MMGKAHPPEVIEAGLQAMVAHGGNARMATWDLAEDGIEVSTSALRSWKNELHAERYQELELEHGRELEALTIARMRSNASLGAEIQAELLEEMRPEKVEKELRPQALRAVADATAKSVDKTLSLTGRPTDGRAEGPDMAALLRSLGEKGLVKLNVNVDVVDGTAEEDPPDAIEAPEEST